MTVVLTGICILQPYSWWSKLIKANKGVKDFNGLQSPSQDMFLCEILQVRVMIEKDICTLYSI